MVRNVVRHPAPVGSRRVAFTGYRPQKMPFGFDELDERCVDFKTRLYNTIETLIEQGYKHFLSGGALGMDMFAAEAVLELKHKYPDIVLEMVSPFDAQAAKWAPQYQRRHDWLYEEADIVTATGHEYTKSAIRDQQDEAANYEMRAAAFLAEAIATGRFYVDGESIDIRPGNVSSMTR